eukprot:357435-Chlamydomonas_euryale.AAC.7
MGVPGHSGPRVQIKRPTVPACAACRALPQGHHAGVRARPEGQGAHVGAAASRAGKVVGKRSSADLSFSPSRPAMPRARLTCLDCPHALRFVARRTGSASRWVQWRCGAAGMLLACSCPCAADLDASVPRAAASRPPVAPPWSLRFACRCIAAAASSRTDEPAGASGRSRGRSPFGTQRPTYSPNWAGGEAAVCAGRAAAAHHPMPVGRTAVPRLRACA